MTIYEQLTKKIEALTKAYTHCHTTGSDMADVWRAKKEQIQDYRDNMAPELAGIVV